MLNCQFFFDFPNMTVVGAIRQFRQFGLTHKFRSFVPRQRPQMAIFLLWANYRCTLDRAQITSPSYS